MPDDQFSPQAFGFSTFGYSPNWWFKNLGVLFYIGGASAHPKSFNRLISDGLMGPPQLERLPLVSALYRTLLGFIDAGHAESSIGQMISFIKMLFRFAERNGKSITVDNMVDVFCAWVNSLVQRTELAKHDELRYDRDCGTLSHIAAYIYCSRVAAVPNVALAQNEDLMAMLA